MFFEDADLKSQFICVLLTCDHNAKKPTVTFSNKAVDRRNSRWRWPGHNLDGFCKSRSHSLISTVAGHRSIQSQVIEPLTTKVASYWNIDYQSRRLLSHWLPESQVTEQLPTRVAGYWTLNYLSRRLLNHWLQESKGYWTIDYQSRMSLNHWPLESHVTELLTTRDASYWTFDY